MIRGGAACAWIARLSGRSQLYFDSLIRRLRGPTHPVRARKDLFVRFVWAIAAFVLAALMIAAGIAQRTVFEGPKSESAALPVSHSAPYLLIDGAVLNKLPGVQRLEAHGGGEVFAAYGRTADVAAWLSDTSYNHVSLSSHGTLVDTLVGPHVAPAATGDADGGDGGVADGASPDAVQTPAGSDLWLDEFQQDRDLSQSLQLPSGMSVLVASDGVKPAPSKVSITWPRQTAAPWSGPLMVGGAVLMVVGVVLYILAIRHVRRSRGPRRKGLPPLPQTEPIDLAVGAADKGVISSGPATTRRTLSGRRGFAAIPVVVASGLLFAGCSPNAWPSFDASPSPSPSHTVVAPEGQQAPAVTETQAGVILRRISKTVATADQKMDSALASTRLDGAARDERLTNYTLRAKVPDSKELSPIPSGGVRVVLPQAYDGWPRTVMLISEQKAASATTSTIMMITQHDPWSPYKMSYLAALEATTMPKLAPAYVGASQVPPDSSFLVMAPDQIAASYADILNVGEKSSFNGEFEATGDQFRTGVANDRKKRLDSFAKTAANTGSLSFASSAGAEPPLALATLESGAIVAVNLNETDTVKPTNPDAVIKLDGNPTVKALSGADQSQTGFTTTYSDQLFFYVPGQGSADTKIRLLGYASNILGAKVIS